MSESMPKRSRTFTILSGASRMVVSRLSGWVLGISVMASLVRSDALGNVAVLLNSKLWRERKTRDVIFGHLAVAGDADRAVGLGIGERAAAIDHRGDGMLVGLEHDIGVGRGGAPDHDRGRRQRRDEGLGAETEADRRGHPAGIQ